jgi:hypothetical protein
MAPDQRRQVILLAVLATGLAALVIWQLRPAADGGVATAPAARGQSAAARTAPGAEAEPSDPLEVSLDRLAAIRPEPAGSNRNPFRFRPDPPPAPPPSLPPSATRAPAEELGPTGPPTPPPPAPIAFKFIGVLTAEGPGKVAVLSDGRAVYHGREGEIIEGRYRIIRIGEESIQMEHLDGRGRQTIRLSGS